MQVKNRSKRSVKLEKLNLSSVRTSADFLFGMIIPDTHAIYHNKLSWKLVSAVVEDREPDLVVDLGDHFDCYPVSQHRKDPARRAHLTDEIKGAQELLRTFDYVKRKYFVEGNHEWRLARYLMDFAPEVYELLLDRTDNDLFGLKKMGWAVTPYMQSITIGKLNATHDLDKAGENAVADAMASFMDNVIIGHTHLLRYVVKGTAFGVPHLGASFGWLGDVEKIDYRHAVKARRDYVQGFGTFRLDPETGYSWVTPVPIFGNTCCVEGKVYKI